MKGGHLPPVVSAPPTGGNSDTTPRGPLQMQSVWGNMVKLKCGTNEYMTQRFGIWPGQCGNQLSGSATRVCIKRDSIGFAHYMANADLWMHTHHETKKCLIELFAHANSYANANLQPNLLLQVRCVKPCKRPDSNAAKFFQSVKPFRDTLLVSVAM